MKSTFAVKKSVALKYRLNLHKAMPEYPTGDDVIFDILNWILHVLNTKNKEFDINSLKFTPASLKYIFTEEMKSSTFKTDIKAVIKELMTIGDITTDGNSFYVSANAYSRFFN